MTLIRDLPSATTPLSGTEKLEVEQVLQSRQISVAQLAAAISSGLFLQGGAGAVARTSNSKMGEVISVKDFGAVGDDVADDTVALQAAINYAISSKKRLVAPPGTYKTTASLVATGRLYFVGSGGGAFTYSVLPATVGTVIKAYHGGSVLQLTAANGGSEISGMVLDANSQAAYGLRISSVIKGIFDDVTAKNATIDCVRLDCSVLANTMFCTFRNLNIESAFAGAVGLHVTGHATPALANTCHNVFINTKIDFTGAGSYGIVVGNADNCVFYQTYIFCAAGGTHLYGVRLNAAEAVGFPISVGFHHLQASVHGMTVDNGLVDNYVIGYMQDNGQPDPTYNPALARFYWADTTGRQSMMRSITTMGSLPGLNLASEIAVAVGVTNQPVVFPFGNEPNANYQPILSPKWNCGSWWISARSASGFTASFATAPAGVPSGFGWVIVRTG